MENEEYTLEALTQMKLDEIVALNERILDEMMEIKDKLDELE
jgi:hypothetical protein